MKKATTKGLIAFNFGSFVKSKDMTHIPFTVLYTFNLIREGL